MCEGPRFISLKFKKKLENLVERLGVINAEFS
jgi:hypothetical protein